MIYHKKLWNSKNNNVLYFTNIYFIIDCWEFETTNSFYARKVESLWKYNVDSKTPKSDWKPPSKALKCINHPSSSSTHLGSGHLKVNNQEEVYKENKKGLLIKHLYFENFMFVIHLFSNTQFFAYSLWNDLVPSSSWGTFELDETSLGNMDQDWSKKDFLCRTTHIRANILNVFLKRYTYITV